VIVALHKALNRISSSSQRVVLTADANRAWTLQQALCFAVAMEEGLASSNAERRRISSRSSGGSSSSSVLAYVEEPTQDPRDMSTFYAETGIAVAVDESLDEGLVGPQHVVLNPAAAEAGLNPDDSSSSSSSSSRERLDLSDSSGLVAVVIKPAVVGGFERAWGLAHWAQQEGLRVVISSSFESSVGLAALVQLAAAVDAAAAGSTSSSSSSDGGNSGASSNVLPNGLWAGFGGSGLPSGTTAAAAAAAAAGAAKAGNAEKQQQQQQQWHGLGTLSWFAGDTVGHANSLRCFGSSIPAAAAWKLLQQTGTAAAADGTTSSSSSNGTPDLQLCGSCVLPVQYQVLSAAGTPMVVTGSLVTPSSSSSSSGSNGQLPVVLLHGFMGADTDWHPLMAALAAAGHSCLAVNLPGHGGTGPAAAAAAAVAAGECYSLETAAAVAEQAAAAAFGAGTPCLLIGYSMGARAAMQAVLGKQSSPPPQQQQGAGATSSTTTPRSNGSSSRDTVRWAGAVLISGTPGIPDPELRAARVAKDQELADLLRAVGAASFLRWWYRQPLWASLRAYPGFERLLAKRVGEQEGQEEQLAASLTYASTGRMVSMAWGVGLVGAG
jgi:isochorismate synthase/2-succinyl-5-enolpyruvyl-6-hydroxy-3-cyclohexene-1-carboxylate synthase/2-succinyl-6-hydroxy-2,4-cyclohexadiene-1-carboxylate synthase/O-succinylbenzoate synthase